MKFTTLGYTIGKCHLALKFENRYQWLAAECIIYYKSLTISIIFRTSFSIFFPWEFYLPMEARPSIMLDLDENSGASLKLKLIKLLEEFFWMSRIWGLVWVEHRVSGLGNIITITTSCRYWLTKTCLGISSSDFSFYEIFC